MSDARQQLADTIKSYSPAELKRRGERGSAVHRAIEARLLGNPVDHADLERNGATAWLAGVDQFIADARPSAALVEAVAFCRRTLTACTLDFFGDLPGLGLADVVIDWKTREKRHDRYAKDAAQLGGQIDMMTNGYYMDADGWRRQVAEVNHAGIVTICPDGTWALHPVDPAEAFRAWRRTIDLRPSTLVGHVYGRAQRGAAFDIGAVVTERLAALTPEQRSATAMRWRDHGLPKVAELTVEHWALADKLLTDAEPKATPAPTVYASVQECAAVEDRIASLPEDLRDQVRRSGGGLRSPMAAVVTSDELDEWERLLVPAEATAARRPAQAMHLLADLEDEDIEAVLCAVNVRHALWTDNNLDRLAELVAAVQAGHLTACDGTLVASNIDLPKRETTATAKRIAADIGRAKPSRYDDVLADVVLLAAVLAA